MNEQEIDLKKIEQDKIRKQIDNLVDQYEAIEFGVKLSESFFTIQNMKKLKYNILFYCCIVLLFFRSTIQS